MKKEGLRQCPKCRRVGELSRDANLFIVPAKQTTVTCVAANCKKTSITRIFRKVHMERFATEVELTKKEGSRNHDVSDVQVVIVRNAVVKFRP